MNFETKIKMVKKDKMEYWDETKFLEAKLSEAWNSISPELYTIFWYLSIHNLVVPAESY
jgi:hypothetical protein